MVIVAILVDAVFPTPINKIKIRGDTPAIPGSRHLRTRPDPRQTRHGHTPIGLFMRMIYTDMETNEITDEIRILWYHK